jgi:hypothetical protein
VEHYGACVVLLPSDARPHEGGGEHCSVIYFGDDAQNPTLPYEAAMQMTKTLAACYPAFNSVVSQHSVFGPEGDQVTVAELAMNRQLAELRQCYERFNGSQYKEFKPHITAVDGFIRPVNSVVRFNRLACWFDQEKACWLLGSNRMVAA